MRPLKPFSPACGGDGREGGEDGREGAAYAVLPVKNGENVPAGGASNSTVVTASPRISQIQIVLPFDCVLQAIVAPKQFAV